MKIKAGKLTGALAIMVCAGGLSYAGSYKVGANVEVVTSNGVFHVKDAADNRYAQVSGLKHTETSLYGEGPFSAINKHEAADDTDVIGVDINGRSELSLERVPGGVMVSVDMLIDDVVNGVPVNLANNYKAIAEFTRGSWEEYLAGNSVELQLTDEGQKMATEAVTANTKRMLRKIKDMFAAQLQSTGAEFGDVALERLAVKGKTIIKGTSSRLEVVGAPTTIEMSFVINANF